jgi:hypothetical protein
VEGAQEGEGGVEGSVEGAPELLVRFAGGTHHDVIAVPAAHVRPLRRTLVHEDEQVRVGDGYFNTLTRTSRCAWRMAT